MKIGVTGCTGTIGKEVKKNLKKLFVLMEIYLIKEK